MPLIGIPSLIAGIVLMTAGRHWFSGAHQVGVIVTVASAAVIVIGFVIAAAIIAAGTKTSRSRF